MMTWLHLSDLHLNSSDIDTGIFKYINYLITEKIIQKIDFVFLTGDVNDKGPKSPDITSNIIINNISEYLQIDRDNIFLVTGNHDINNKMEIARGSDAQRIINSINGYGSYPELSDYYLLYEKILDKRECPYKLYFTVKAEDQNYIYYVVHINSIWLTKILNPDITHGNSSTYYLVLELIAKELEKCKNNFGKRSIIFILNHFPVRSLNRRDLDLFESMCNDFNVNFILSGHTHTAWYNTFGENKFIEIVCRSAFNADANLYKPGFVIGKLDSCNGYRISYYSKDKEGWGVDKKVLGITDSKGFIQGTLYSKNVLPLPKLPDQFIERNNISELLEREYKISRIINLYGFAGEGKTILALQFTKTRKALVWWIDAKDETTFINSLRNIIFTNTSLNQGDDINEVLVKIFNNNVNTRFFIVIDNVIDPNITKLLPKVIMDNANVSILITSYLLIENLKNVSIASENKSSQGRIFLTNLLEQITEKKADRYAREIVSKYSSPLFIKMIGHMIFQMNCSYQYYLSKYLYKKGLPIHYSPSDYKKGLRVVTYNIFKVIFDNSKSAIHLLYIICQFSQAPFKREWFVDNFNLFSCFREQEQEQIDIDFGLLISYSLIEPYHKNEYKQKHIISKLFEDFIVEQNIDLGPSIKSDCIRLIEKLFNYDYFTYKSALKNTIFESHAQQIATKFQNLKTIELFDLQNKLGYFYWQMSDFDRSLSYLNNNKMIWELSDYTEESLVVFSCYSCIGRILLSQDKYLESIPYIKKAKTILDKLESKNLIPLDLKGISGILGSKAQNSPYLFFKSNILYSLSLLYLNTGEIDKCLEAIKESLFINNHLGINNVQLHSHCERIYVREFVYLVATFKQSIERELRIDCLLGRLSEIENKAHLIIKDFSTAALISKAILRLIGFAYSEFYKKYPTGYCCRYYHWSEIFDIASTDPKFYEKLLQIKTNIEQLAYS